MDHPPEHAPYPLDALKAVERVVWDNGITGDACARVAAQVIRALTEAGFDVVPSRPA